jgi:hypothetical protein
VAILAFDGAGGGAPLPQFQMATLALAVKSVFQVKLSGARLHQMAGLAFYRRQTLPPLIAAADKVVMAGSTMNVHRFVGSVLEKHRTFGPGLKFIALQGTYRFWRRGAEDFGAQEQGQRHSQKQSLIHPLP